MVEHHRSPHHALRNRRELQVQVLHVPECPHLDDLLSLVERCLAATGRVGAVETIEGPYASPTLRINGQEVLGAAGRGPSCRLEVPTEGQVLAALDRFEGANDDRHIEIETGREIPGATRKRRMP